MPNRRNALVEAQLLINRHESVNCRLLIYCPNDAIRATLRRGAFDHAFCADPEDAQTIANPGCERLECDASPSTGQPHAMSAVEQNAIGEGLAPGEKPRASREGKESSAHADDRLGR